MKLKEFEFQILRHRVGDRVCIQGCFHELPIHPEKICQIKDPFDLY